MSRSRSKKKVAPILSLDEVRVQFKNHLFEGKVNLKDLLPEELIELLKALGQPSYRAEQLIRWIYVRFVDDFSVMTDLSSETRQMLLDDLA